MTASGDPRRAEPAVPAPATDQRDGRSGWVLTAVALPVFLGAADPPLLALISAGIAERLGDPRHAHWIAAGYLAAALPGAWIGGRLGDTLGYRRVLRYALLLYGIGALGAMRSADVAALAGWRVLQGLGGGGLIVLAQAAVGQYVAARQRPRFQGRLAVVFAAANLVGLFGGALFVAHLGWPALFAGEVLLSLIALWLLRRLDKVPYPVLPRVVRSVASSMWRLRGMPSVCLCLLAYSASLFLALSILPRVHGPSTVWSVSLPMVLGQLSGSWISGRLARPERFDGRLCSGGLAASCLALLILGTVPLGDWTRASCVAVCALGFGPAMPTAQLAAQALSGRSRLGAAASMVSLSRAAGSALGAWAGGICLAWPKAAVAGDWSDSLQPHLCLAAAAAAGAAYASIRIPRVNLIAARA